MEKPTITINGEEKEVGKISARLGSDAMRLEKEFKTLSPVDFIDKCADILARTFNVSADDILDNLTVSDVMEKYFDVYAYMIHLLFSKVASPEEDINQAQG